MTVYGSNFGTVRSTWEKGISTIYIQGRECLRTVWLSDTKVRCTVPPGWSKKRKVRLEGVAEQKAKDKVLFSYLRPVVRKVSPNTAPTEFDKGSVVVVIDGDNFGECGGKF